MKTFFIVVIILELAVSTCVVCLADENPAPAVATAAESNSPERKIASTRLSTNVTEVVRLVESDVEDEVALAYIENSQTPFELSAEHVIYLKDIGINAPLIAAMLRQDTVLRDRQALAGAATGATNQFAYDQKLYPSSSNAQPAAVPEPVYVTNAPPEVTYFYDTLRPYGTWIELESYGWCWQPHVVVIDRYWRPYWQSGRWLWSDLGWYWCSDYSWGWAPFHYGRWHHHPRCGWVWFPDRVWAPAWVCWRYSNSHCGWAPLPPGAHFAAGRGFRFNNVSVGINFDFGLRADLFTFVEIGRLHERHPHLHAVPEGRVKDIYNQTTVINNYVSGRDNRIINQGVGIEHVAAASRSEIRKVTIQDEPAAPGRVVKPERVETAGATAVLYRHELMAPTKPVPVAAQRIDERHPVVRSTPVRAPALTPPPDGSQPGRISPGPAQPVWPVRIPPRTPPTTKPTPPPTAKPEPAKGRENRQSAPPSTPVQPTSPQPARPPASPPASFRTVPSQPPRPETPKGLQQRLSNGAPMQRVPPPSAGAQIVQPSPRQPAESNPRVPGEPRGK